MEELVPCWKCGEPCVRGVDKCPYCNAAHPTAEINLAKTLGMLLAYLLVTLGVSFAAVWLSVQ